MIRDSQFTIYQYPSTQRRREGRLSSSTSETTSTPIPSPRRGIKAGRQALFLCGKSNSAARSNSPYTNASTSHSSVAMTWPPGNLILKNTSTPNPPPNQGKPLHPHERRAHQREDTFKTMVQRRSLARRQTPSTLDFELRKQSMAMNIALCETGSCKEHGSAGKA